MAIEVGVCEKEYGERLLALVQSAIQLSPYEAMDFSRIAESAEKARSDNKNTEDGLIQMAVAKTKNEWTMLFLPFEEYRAALVRAAKV